MTNSPWWLIALAGIGVLAMIGTIITLFTSLGRRPARFRADANLQAGSDEFLQALSVLMNVPLEHGGTVTLLNNGDEFFPDLLDEVGRARNHINFLVYIWEPGDLSMQIFEALAAAARRGVQVRVLLDGMGGLRTPAAGIEMLKAAGGQVERFRPPRFGKLARFYRRNHRRAIIIDGKVGYTGGIAIGQKWLGHAQDRDHWRDMMIKVTGRMAVSLQSAFTEPWAYVCGEMLTAAEFYPDHDGDLARKHLHVVSSPSSEEHPLRLLFMLSFLSAREKLYIATSYFVPDRQTREAVAERARAGVDVRILVPNEVTDAPPIRLAGRSYYEELLASGIRIYEYQPTMMHAKCVVIDGTWSLVGSANMDIRSKELNQENVMGIRDTCLARQLEQSFLDDLGNAREIRLDEWQHRGLMDRLKERFWVLFAEQY